MFLSGGRLGDQIPEVCWVTVKKSPVIGLQDKGAVMWPQGWLTRKSTDRQTPCAGPKEFGFIPQQQEPQKFFVWRRDSCQWQMMG